MHRTDCVHLSCLIAALGLGLSPASARAGAVPAGATADIVVTAQKREQKAADVAIPLAVLDSEALRLRGSEDVVAIARGLPGLQVQTFSPSIVIFNIRGVSQNDYSDAQEGPIAFYEDEAYASVAGAIAGRDFDLQRVEVLRGPQGTIFGRNATGGLVQYVSARPSAQAGVVATLAGGSHGEVMADLAVTGPLAEGLRARLAGRIDRHGGYVDNLAGAPLGNRRQLAGRLQVEADLGASTLLLKAEGVRNAHERSAGLYAHAAAAPDALGLGTTVGARQDPFGTCPGCDALGYRAPSNDPFRVEFNDPIRFDRTLGEGMARLESPLGAARLVAIVDYQHLTKDYAEDSDMSPATMLTSANYQRLHQWSGELRLSGSGPRVDWVVGGNALSIVSFNHYVIDASNSAGLLEDYGGTLKTSSAALFGQAEWRLGSGWSMVGGLRFTHDRKSYDFTHAENGMTDLVLNPRTMPGLAARNFDDWAGRFQLNWRPAEGVLLYAGVDRGTKSGGYSAPAVLPRDITAITFGPERLTAWSGGIKAAAWQRRLELAASLFHYDYAHYQAFENTDGYTLSVHNKDARIDGAELEASLLAGEGLTLRGSAQWLDARVLRVVLPSGAVLDRRMPNAPRFSATAGLDWRHRSGAGTFALASTWRYDAAQFLTPFNAEVDREGPRLVGDARVSFQPASMPQVTFAAFATNVTNRRYRLFDIDFSQNFGFVQSSYARPRWFGVSVGWQK